MSRDLPSHYHVAPSSHLHMQYIFWFQYALGISYCTECFDYLLQYNLTNTLCDNCTIMWLTNYWYRCQNDTIYWFVNVINRLILAYVVNLFPLIWYFRIYSISIIVYCTCCSPNRLFVHMSHDPVLSSRDTICSYAYAMTSCPNHLDLSRCPLLHKSLQPPTSVLQTERVVIQPESLGCVPICIWKLH